jgi:alpha-amylase
MHFATLDEPLVRSPPTPDDWRDEVIYQVLVDRFADGDDGNNFPLDRDRTWPATTAATGRASSSSSTTSRSSASPPCGSPRSIKNVETDANVDGYHGYWARTSPSPNPTSATSSLRSLVDAAHERDMQGGDRHRHQPHGPAVLLRHQPQRRARHPARRHRRARRGGIRPVRVTHITEYDPDFDPRGIQAFTSLGLAGPGADHLPLRRRRPTTSPRPPRSSPPRDLQPQGPHLQRTTPEQLLTGDFPGGLKDVDTTRYDVKVAMVDAYARWIELTDADGFRIDTVKHVEREFWRYFTQRVRQRLAARARRTSSCSARPSTATTRPSASSPRTTRPPPRSSPSTNKCQGPRPDHHRRPARLRLLLPPALHGVSAT